MKILLKTLKYMVIAILAVLLIFNLISIAQRIILKREMPMLLGFGTAIVITGSMEPTVSPNDMVIIHEQSGYKTGDIITYRENSYITHRIVEKTENGYITRGDANNTTDGEIQKSQIAGKVVMIIPKVGIVIGFLKTPLGILILMIGLFALVELPILIKSHKHTDIS